MGVPSSGAISMAGLAAEKLNDDYGDADFDDTISLTDLVLGGDDNGSHEEWPVTNANSTSKPNTNAPHAMSEWYGYDHDAAASFSDSYAASKSITTGVGQTIRIADSNGKFNFDQDDAYSFSFWVKAGWNSSLNTNIHLFAANSNQASSYQDLIRVYYREDNNRLYFQYASASPTAYKQAAWLFHANSGNYAAAYAAAGLGSSFWSSSNRGNVGDDNYTLLTFVKGASNSAGTGNVMVYWNATPLGLGIYGTGGNSSGTVNQTGADRQVALGSNVWSYAKSGNATETQFNDFAFWNKKLSASEVTAIYNGGTRTDLTQHSASGNLKGYYKFENNGNDSSASSGNPFVLSGNSNIASV